MILDGEVATGNRGYVNGRYYTCPYYIGIGTAGTQIAGRLYAIPIYIREAITITKLGINVAVAATVAGSNARLGIYNNVNAAPGNLLLDAGEIDLTTTTGEKEVTISYAIQPGWYWLAVIYEDVTTLTVTLQTSASILVGEYGATTALDGATCIRVTQAYGTLPATFPAVANSDYVVSNMPRIWFRKGV